MRRQALLRRIPEDVKLPPGEKARARFRELYLSGYLKLHAVKIVWRIDLEERLERRARREDKRKWG